MQGIIQQHFYIANTGNLKVGGGSSSSAGDWAVKAPVQTNTSEHCQGTFKQGT